MANGAVNEVLHRSAPAVRLRVWSLSSRVMMAAISACAWAMETPGLRRATAFPLELSLSAICCGVSASGIQTCVVLY